MILIRDVNGRMVARYTPLERIVKTFEYLALECLVLLLACGAAMLIIIQNPAQSSSMAMVVFYVVLFIAGGKFSHKALAVWTFNEEEDAFALYRKTGSSLQLFLR